MFTKKLKVKKSVHAAAQCQGRRMHFCRSWRKSITPPLHIYARLSAYRPEATNNTQRLICRTHSQVNAALVCLKCRQALCRHTLTQIMHWKSLHRATLITTFQNIHHIDWWGQHTNILPKNPNLCAALSREHTNTHIKYEQAPHILAAATFQASEQSKLNSQSCAEAQASVASLLRRSFIFWHFNFLYHFVLNWKCRQFI